MAADVTAARRWRGGCDLGKMRAFNGHNPDDSYGYHNMNNVTQLPPFSKTIHIEAEITISRRGEFDRAMAEIVAGGRPRMDTFGRNEASIEARAMASPKTIKAGMHTHPTSGQSRRLVRFLAGVCNGRDYPFDLTALRGLDAELANACLDYRDYLNYDRLGRTGVHTHLVNGDRDLHRWLDQYDIKPLRSRSK
jgi:hypothetical protein